jgi:phage baseplate assembly protein gpV
MMRVIMHRLRAVLKRDIEDTIARQAVTRLATVASVDPVNHLVKVLIQPEGTLSNWCHDGAMMATGGFGIMCPANVGDQVLVHFAHGDADNPIVGHRIFSTVDPTARSPATNGAVQPGEIGIFTKGGGWLHMVADGSVHCSAPNGAYITAPLTTITGNVKITQNLTVLGDMNIDGTADGSTGAITARGQVTDLNGSRGSLNDLRGVHNIHIHPGVQSGGENTQATLQTK